MKKSLLFLFFVGAVFSLSAQNGPVDFETPGFGADWTWTVFENDTNPALEIIDNPDPNGANTSATVAKFTALQAGQPFAGCETMMGADIGPFTLTPTTSTISIMVWKSVISDVGIKLVDAGFGSLGEIKVANTLTDQWEKVTFDFSSMEGIEYVQIVVFPDFNARSMDNVIYFDNITFGDQISSVRSFSANQVELFPNPAQNVVNIRAEEEIESIKVYSTLGALLIEQQVSGNAASFDVAHLPQGVYIINAVIDGVTLVDRLIKD